MSLQNIYINNLRNISDKRFALHPHINVINGLNGSGKTAFLEALSILSLARSFRTRELLSLVTHTQQTLNVHAETVSGYTISVQKSLKKATAAYINKTACATISELSRLLPMQIFYQDIFEIIDASPAVRRSVLDWGLFYVVNDYHDILKQYSRALQQRNILLKQQAQTNQFLPWNKILSTLAIQIDNFRHGYIVQLNQIFQEILAQLTTITCSLEYYKGWDRYNTQQSLEMLLSDSLSIDLKYTYTRIGAHQAELLFVSDNYKVKNYLSRGQQKMILFALKLAQSCLIKQNCIFLMDDLFTELDEVHQIKLMHYINNMSGQFFLTSTGDKNIKDLLPSCDYMNIKF